jgi:hypothetical protein
MAYTRGRYALHQLLVNRNTPRQYLVRLQQILKITICKRRVAREQGYIDRVESSIRSLNEPTL